MIHRDVPELSLSRQCELLSIGRSSLYYRPKGESAENLTLTRRIDKAVALPTSPQAQQQQENLLNTIFAA